MNFSKVKDFSLSPIQIANIIGQAKGYFWRYSIKGKLIEFFNFIKEEMIGKWMKLELQDACIDTSPPPGNTFVVPCGGCVDNPSQNRSTINQ